MFWESSVLEIQDMMQAHDRRLEAEFKNDVMIGFSSADAVATRVAYLFSDTKKRRESDIIQPWDSFPALFENTKEQAAESKRDAELEQYKANMRAFADRWNRRFRDGSKDNI